MPANLPNEGPHAEMPPDGVDVRDITEEQRARFVAAVKAMGRGTLVPIIDDATAQRDEAERLLMAMVQRDPFGEWADGCGVTCWYCGAERGGCVSGCAHSDARHYVAYRGLLPVSE